MKTLTLTAILIVSLLSGACFVNVDDNSTQISGNGNVKTETRTLESFSAIENETIFDIELIQSDVSKIEFEIDETILPHVVSNIESGKLILSLDCDNIKDVKCSKAKIYSPEFVEIANEGVGSINGGKIKSSKFKISNEGVGSINLNIDADVIEVDNDGVGSIKLLGDASSITVSNDGIGSVDASELNVVNASVSNDGLGSVKINASGEVRTDNSGLGGISVTGTNNIIKK